MVSPQGSRNHQYQRSCSPRSIPFSPQTTSEPSQVEHVKIAEARSFSDSGTIFNLPSPHSSIDNSAGIRSVSLSSPSSHHYTMSFDELESKFRSLQQENHSLRQRLRQGKTQFSMVLESLHEQEQRHQEDEEEAEELRSMVNEANAQTADVLEENYSLRAELKHWSDRRKQKNIRRKPGVCALNLEEQKLSSQPHCMSPLERQLLHVQRQTSPTPGPSPPPLTPDLPEVESPTSVAPPPPPSSGSQSVDPPDYFYQQIERSGQFSFTAKSEASVEPVPSRRNAVSISQESDIARSLHELSLKVNGPSLELSAPRPSSRPDELTPPATPPFLEAWMRNSGILERIREEDEGDARYALQKAHGGDSRIGAWDAPAQ